MAPPLPQYDIQAFPKSRTCHRVPAYISVYE